MGHVLVVWERARCSVGLLHPECSHCKEHFPTWGVAWQPPKSTGC